LFDPVPAVGYLLPGFPFSRGKVDERTHSDVFAGGFTKVPAFFVDDLMPIAPGIPASFWKFLRIVWRDCFGQRRKCSKTMTQFHMTKGTASKWTAALYISHLFYVRYGKRHEPNLPGVPTEIRYKEDSTQEDWLSFIAALRDTLLADKRQHFSDVEGFRVQLAINLIAERQRNGLSTTVLDRFIADQPEGSVNNAGGTHVLNPEWRGQSDRTGVLTADDKAYFLGEEPKPSRSIR
jgi:hypothetical protein